jgi:hypothetical protein
VWLRQLRDGHEHHIALALDEVDVVIEWIRSARAEAERRRAISGVARALRQLRRRQPAPGRPSPLTYGGYGRSALRFS